MCARSPGCVRGSPTSSSGTRPDGCATSRRLAAGHQIDAVLTDAMFVAARLWHERGGPVWASLGDGPLTYADVDTPPYGAGLLPMRGREGRRRNRVTTRILRGLIWGPALERLGAIRCELGLVQSGRSVLEEAMSPHLHLQACVPEFEYPRHDLPAQVRFVGALRPESATDRKLPPWWAEFLADDRPAVLVSQGTLRPDLTELVLPTIAALTGAGRAGGGDHGGRFDGRPAGRSRARGARTGSGWPAGSRTRTCCRTSTPSSPTVATPG